jgi:2-polyprenyl-6-methoxyphenol hydroxylase-like FAD-dependent oxidoreductase
MACELARHGLAPRLIEELPAPVTFSKAAVVHSRTMEVFDDMGFAKALALRAKPVHGLNAFAGGKRVAHVTLTGVDSPFPFPCGVSQHETELALATHFASLGGVVERGKRVAKLEQNEDGVIATLTSGETIAARWVVGCDGAHSVVRKEIGCSFEGAPYEERLIQADVHIEIPGTPVDDEIMAFLHEDGPVLMFPLFRDGRYRLIVLEVPSPDVARGELEPTLEVFQRLVDERGPKGARVSDPAWMIGFKIHHRRTDRFRVGRAFLAGDAAHIHSPVGGQGMNTGIQDAYNLAWKLALVARGVAHDSILDSYDAERAPVVRSLVDSTDRAMQGLELAIGLRNPIAQALRNQLLSFASSLSILQERAARTLSMLTVSYKDSPLVRQDRVPVWRANVLAGVASEQPSLADWAAFGDAPGPGERAADAAFEGGKLFDLFHGTRHVALLFDGAASTAEGYAYLARVATRIRDRLGAWISVHIVVPRAAKPPELPWDGPLVLDAEGAAHQRYGARSECIYLVRPDGYIAYRSLPADEGRLFAYLATVFREEST